MHVHDNTDIGYRIFQNQKKKKTIEFRKVVNTRKDLRRYGLLCEPEQSPAPTIDHM